jgi:hypothetical protein
MTDAVEPAKVWSELASAIPEGKVGWMRRRMQTAGARVHLAVDAQSRRPSVMLDVPLALVPSLGSLQRTSGLSITLKHPEDIPDTQRALTVELADGEFLDLFAVFCGDLVARLATCQHAQDGAAVLRARLARWQEFLSAAKEGLGRQALVGLFGELTFLLEDVVPEAGIGMIVAWTGADRQPQDFVVNALCAVEVKASVSPQLQQVRINGERQLDTTGLSVLFLLCMRLEQVAAGGRSLPELVDGLRKAAEGHGELRSALDMRLGLAGYRDRDAGQYNQFRFIVAEQRVYEVAGGFPRITPAEMPPGTLEASYTLDLKLCSSYLRDRSYLRMYLSQLQSDEGCN